MCVLWFLLRIGLYSRGVITYSIQQSTKRPDDAAEAPKAADMDSEKGAGASPTVDDDVVISAPVHCDGCARKLRRSLQRLAGDTKWTAFEFFFSPTYLILWS